MRRWSGARAERRSQRGKGHRSQFMGRRPRSAAVSLKRVWEGSLCMSGIWIARDPPGRTRDSSCRASSGKASHQCKAALEKTRSYNGPTSPPKCASTASHAKLTVDRPLSESSSRALPSRSSDLSSRRSLDDGYFSSRRRLASPVPQPTSTILGITHPPSFAHAGQRSRAGRSRSDANGVRRRCAFHVVMQMRRGEVPPATEDASVVQYSRRYSTHRARAPPPRACKPKFPYFYLFTFYSRLPTNQRGLVLCYAGRSISRAGRVRCSTRSQMMNGAPVFVVHIRHAGGSSVARSRSRMGYERHRGTTSPRICRAGSARIATRDIMTARPHWVILGSQRCCIMLGVCRGRGTTTAERYGRQSGLRRR